MRVNLKVPYAEKDAAKSLGAWWGPGRKTWCVKDVEDLESFLRWIDARSLRPCKQLKAPVWKH